MSMPKQGSKAPSFKLEDQDGTAHTLSEYAGDWVVLYFYPKDDTPGCTVEACSFRDEHTKLKKAGAVVLGVSTDAPKSHTKFITKFKLPFTLFADVEKKTVNAYGVWAMKKFMGREYMGTLRTTFLIDPKGKIAKVYEKVKPDEHVAEVLADLKELQGKGA